MDIGRRALSEITGRTGGRAFFPFNEDEMIRASEQIARELRSQYELSYRPAEFAGDGRELLSTARFLPKERIQVSRSFPVMKSLTTGEPD